LRYESFNQNHFNHGSSRGNPKLLIMFHIKKTISGFNQPRTVKVCLTLMAAQNYLEELVKFREIQGYTVTRFNMGFIAHQNNINIGYEIIEHE
jgi:hypothetical protein